jgi:hypothetical protein
MKAKFSRGDHVYCISGPSKRGYVDHPYPDHNNCITIRTATKIIRVDQAQYSLCTKVDQPSITLWQRFKKRFLFR